MHNTHDIHSYIALYVSVAVSETLGFGYNHVRVAGW